MKKRIISLIAAKHMYPHRFTMEHVPAWAREIREDGTYYAPQYRSDAEWYENTTFPGEDDVSSDETHCLSSCQTWPLGKSLPYPFQVADL